MSLKVIGSKAQVHWLTNTHHNGTLGPEHGVIYVTRDGKLGKATADSYEGLTPAQAFERRYNGMKSAMTTDFIADDLFVFDKSQTLDTDQDDGIRRLILDLHKKRRMSFSANVESNQIEGTNSEALLGYDRTQHLEQLVSVVKQYLGLGDRYDTRDPITWRWGQREEVEEIVSTLTQHNLCLYAAYTGRGKTKISMEVANRLLDQGGLVLVTTPITDTKQSFRDNIADFHFGFDRSIKSTYVDAQEFARHKVSDLRRRAASGELIFIVLTVQDLRWGDTDTVGIRKKYSQLKRVDLWIRDERHLQYNGEVTSERLADVSARYTLDLTATPYNVLDQYHLDHIVTRTLLWGLNNRAHTLLPQIAIDAVSAPAQALSAALSAVYSEAEGYDPRKLFVRENGSFVLTREIELLADKFYYQSLSKKKNPLSIVNDTTLSDTAKLCGMWVLPQGANGDSAGDYIPHLADMLNMRSQGVYYIDSYRVERQCPADLGVGQYVEQLVDTHGRVVLLTCGKFTTGTDIPVLGHIVLFDRMGSIADFEQLLGRMTRNYPVDDPTKDRVKLYSLVPGHELRVLVGRLARANTGLGAESEWAMLDCVPLSEYDLEGRVRGVSAEEILDSAQTWFQEQLRRSLPAVSLRSAVSGIDRSLWATINTKKFKKHAPQTLLTSQSGARVRTRLTPTQHRQSKSPNSNIHAIADTIQAVMAEAQWVAYSTDNYDYTVVLNQEPIVQMFGQDTVEAVLDAARQSSEIQTLIRTYLLDRQQAYANLPAREVYDRVFVNNELKRDLGLVYLSFDLCDELIDNLPLGTV